MFELSDSNIDTDALRARHAHEASGGFVCFEGWVRDHNDGRPVRGLQYEAYETLAVREGNKIVAEAIERFDVRTAQCQHRIGELNIGGVAVWVGAGSDHREGAFQACRYIIDEVKARVPIWKKELYVDGDTEWIDCRKDEANDV